MKKIILIFSLLVVLASCKSNNAAKSVGNNVENTDGKVTVKESTPSSDGKSEVALKGDWEITKVSFVGSEYFKITSFQLADSQCFVGSIWKFISNNNKGEMTLSKSDCVDFKSPIVWSLNKEKMFSLKILKDLAAKDVTVGYHLMVENQTTDSFDLSDRVNVGGKLTEIVYHFQRK
jgi:hypothetical protein